MTAFSRQIVVLLLCFVFVAMADGQTSSAEPRRSKTPGKEPEGRGTIGSDQKRLAVLISAAWGADEAMHNDHIAMHRALKQRGYRADEILSIEGKLSRGLLLAFLNEVRKDLSAWNEGTVFIYYTGHGSLDGKTSAEAVVGMQLSIEERVTWNEVFATLRLPPRVSLILLPDS